MANRVLEYSYIQDWKSEASVLIKKRYPDATDREIDTYLTKTLEKRCIDPNVIVVNNYTNKISRFTTLQLIELIRSNHLICAGAGCLFLPHNTRRNILIEFIMFVMEQRKLAKKEMYKYPKGSEEYEIWDRKQLAYKLIINSLYGCMGYAGFTMFNIFIAECITTQGRHIITSAANAIENFLGDALWFTNAEEVYNCIYRILNEYHNLGHEFSEGLIAEISKNIDISTLDEQCVDRFLKHCIFPYDSRLINNLRAMMRNMSIDELILLYYKNNYIEFSQIPFMQDKIRNLIVTNGTLMFCEDSSYASDETRAMVAELWEFYKLFVLYDYPIYDRLQKAMYIDKRNSLYTDTDSVFISLDKSVKMIEGVIFHGDHTESGMSKQDLTFTASNVTMTIANNMINSAMMTLCLSLGITPEFGKLLRMKNEFFFSRIMFTDVKKRYLSLAILKEGHLLKDGAGLPEIKGFDFKKAGTKPFVRDYFTKICLEEILYPTEVDPVKIFDDVVRFEEIMRTAIYEGDTKFFKQANVKIPDYYKNPYSTQGVCAIFLWNALNPDKEMSFPTDVNIVPIKPLTFHKGSGERSLKLIRDTDNPNVQWYKDTYPDAYENLKKHIFLNENLAIRHMTLSSIAIPKNVDYAIPEHVVALYNIESLVNNNIDLIRPILKGVGINSFRENASTEYVTNMISI